MNLCLVCFPHLAVPRPGGLTGVACLALLAPVFRSCSMAPHWAVGRDLSIVIRHREDVPSTLNSSDSVLEKQFRAREKIEDQVFWEE